MQTRRKTLYPHFGIKFKLSFDEYEPLYNKLSAMNRRTLSGMKLKHKDALFDCSRP